MGEAFLLSPLAIAVNQITPDVGVKISIYHLRFSGCSLAGASGLGSLTGCSQGVGWGCSQLKARGGKDLLPHSLVLLLPDLGASLAVGQRHQSFAMWAAGNTAAGFPQSK